MNSTHSFLPIFWPFLCFTVIGVHFLSGYRTEMVRFYLSVQEEHTQDTCVMEPVWLPFLLRKGSPSHITFVQTHSTVSPPVHLLPKRTASQGLSLNRSQYGGCSTKYNTPAGNQVVYRRFAGEQVVFPESSHHRTHTGAVA
jgi:hypothetical protein